MRKKSERKNEKKRKKRKKEGNWDKEKKGRRKGKGRNLSRSKALIAVIHVGSFIGLYILIITGNFRLVLMVFNPFLFRFDRILMTYFAYFD